MPLLKRKRVMAAKVEGTIGTAESLTNAEGAFNAYDVMIQPTIAVDQREGQGSFNYLSGVPGARQGKATFKTDIGWDGTTTMPTWASVLLPACGFVESSQVYTPRSEAPGSNVKTATIGCYVDGVFKSIAGAVGNFRLVCPSGKQVMIEWEFTGVWQAPTDVALIAPTYPTALPIRYSSATTTYNSVALCVENFTLDAGNEVILRECASTAAGYISGLVVSRYPRATANPEAVLVATQDRFGAWLAATESALSVVLDGPSTSTITISIPKAQIVNDQESDRGKLVTDEVEWSCNKNGATADQEVSITFAEAA
jgi:hypothetical protein